MAVRSPRPPRSRLHRVLVVRRRLLVSILCGPVLFMLLPEAWGVPTRLLASWDMTALIYVAFAFRMMHRSTHETCRAHAALYDENDWVILLLIVASAAASLGAIVAELLAIKSGRIDPLLGLSIIGATVALSWTFVHTIFALHYANLYYRPAKGRVPGGLEFPGGGEPGYGDFLYYSFVIGCASQTADVNTISPEMRRLSLIHGIVAFAFNTAILALMFNIGAGLISG